MKPLAKKLQRLTNVNIENILFHNSSNYFINFQCVLILLQTKLIIIQTHLGKCEIVSPASMTENKTDSPKTNDETITPNTSEKEATQSKFLLYIFPSGWPFIYYLNSSLLSITSCVRDATSTFIFRVSFKPKQQHSPKYFLQENKISL